MLIESTAVTGPIVVQIDVRSLARTFRQLLDRLGIIEIVLDWHPIRIHNEALGCFLQSLYPRLLNLFLRGGLLDCLCHSLQLRLV